MDSFISMLTEIKIPKGLKLLFLSFFFMLICFDLFLICYEISTSKTPVEKYLPLLSSLNIGAAILATISYLQMGRETIRRTSPLTELVTNWEKDHSNYNRVRLFGEYMQMLKICSALTTLEGPEELRAVMKSKLPSAFWTARYESAYASLVALGIVDNNGKIVKRSLKDYQEVTFEKLF